MSEKIMTEDQYRLFCQAVDKRLAGGMSLSAALESIKSSVGSYSDLLELEWLFVSAPNPLWNELLALANPVSRDLVKEQYVKPAPCHFWVKDLPVSAQDDRELRLAIIANGNSVNEGRIMPTSTLLTPVDVDALSEVIENYFTKAELIESGFDPDAWVAYHELD